jgi:hypothetical protein
VSDGDGTDSSTQVFDFMCAWMTAVPFYHAKHSMSLFTEALTPIAPTWYQKPPDEADESPRASWAGGKRWSGLTGGEILFDHDDRDKGVYFAWIAPKFCSF